MATANNPDMAPRVVTAPLAVLADAPDAVLDGVPVAVVLLAPTV
jgi:hypothetical protein